MVDEEKIELTKMTEMDKQKYFVDLTSREKMYMPKFLYTDPVMANIYKSQGIELSKLNFYIIDLLNQCFIETATWGLDYWEYEYGIKIRHKDTYEVRRARLYYKIRGRNVTNVDTIKKVSLGSKCGAVEVEPHWEEYYFIIKFTSTIGIPANLQDFKDIIEEIKPAHLGVLYKFKYITWGDLLPYTWGEMKPRTWEQARSSDNKPHIILTVDGGDVPSDDLKQMIQHYNAKCCYAIIPEKVGETGFMTLAQIKQLKSEGNEIIAYGTTQLTKDNAETILQDAKSYFDTNDLQTNVYVYPEGNEVADKSLIEAKVKKYFQYGLNKVAGSITETPTNKFDMPRLFISDTCNLSIGWVKTLIDDALINYKTVIISIHGSDFSTSKTYIEETLNYMIAKKAVIKTFGEIFE